MSKALTPEERRLLKGVFTGHDCLADISDFLGKPTYDVMQLTERLEIGGFLERVGKNYLDWLKFRVTDKGMAELPEMSEEERVLAEKYQISIEDFRVLRSAHKLGKKNSSGSNLSDDTGYGTMFIVPCLDNLERKGYVKMVGTWRRLIVVTGAGAKLLDEAKVTA